MWRSPRSEELVRTRATDGLGKGPDSAAKSPYPGGYARGSMDWLTVRLIMRIADIVAAAAIAGRGQFFSRPSRARAELANEVRLGLGSLTGACAVPSTG